MLAKHFINIMAHSHHSSTLYTNSTCHNMNLMYSNYPSLVRQIHTQVNVKWRGIISQTAKLQMKEKWNNENSRKPKEDFGSWANSEGAFWVSSFLQMSMCTDRSATRLLYTETNVRQTWPYTLLKGSWDSHWEWQGSDKGWGHGGLSKDGKSLSLSRFYTVFPGVSVLSTSLPSIPPLYRLPFIPLATRSLSSTIADSALFHYNLVEERVILLFIF